MTTDARTWFYTTPEARPYYIEERVNQTLWKHRLVNIFMSCTQATPPIQMAGKWGDVDVAFEWQPGKYFTLRSSEENLELVGVIRQMLMLRPALSYYDTDNNFVVEWHTDGGAERWNQVQGNPAFQGLKRLRKK
ncbi:MAG: hypothetical protein D6737_15835 [Chloroflexi bacterium]|nr:MAG: hypothetical protein D6737_15835 [Chloroflexota bacterium]